MLNESETAKQNVGQKPEGIVKNIFHRPDAKNVRAAFFISFLNQLYSWAVLHPQPIQDKAR